MVGLQVYETVHGFFKKPNSSGKSLTTKDMVQMGLKVTGISGAAKLKVGVVLYSALTVS